MSVKNDDRHMLAFRAKAKQVWQTARDKAERHSKDKKAGLHFHCEDLDLTVTSEHLWTMCLHLSNVLAVSPRDIGDGTLVDFIDDALADQLKPFGLGVFIKESRGVRTLHFQPKV